MLVPFKPPKILLDSLAAEIKTLGFRYYPERNLNNLKEIIGEFHQINPDNILPGNGASELITWAGYEASKFELVVYQVQDSQIMKDHLIAGMLV